MKTILTENLIRLAEVCSKPLYVVGGSVRDHLAGLSAKTSDIDIAGAMPPEEFLSFAKQVGFQAKAVYKNTGTVKLVDGENEYEYACFRSDKYVRGEHTPSEIFFTEDIALDAKRRDFTANAVYYDVKNEVFVDPLGGIPAIKEKRLTTVDNAKKVFGEDGLRLMRLARQSAQLGFTPDAECLKGAKQNVSLIHDVSAERVYTELCLLLSADEKYGATGGHYRGLQILDQIGVLDEILPELTAGRGITQRADFHKYDVLEHSLRAALYAPPHLRLAALLHDVGKPFCFHRDGNFFQHPVEGEKLTENILQRLKAPKKETALVKYLTRFHMYDFDGKTKESKLRRFLVENAPNLSDLLSLKQADFSACTDDLSPCPTSLRWNALFEKMQSEGVPFSLKQLKVSGKELAENGIPNAYLSKVLRALLLHAAITPADNHKAQLFRLSKGAYQSILKEEKQ